MRVLVTGASGFLGRNLVLKLLQQGVDVVAIHRRPLPPFEAPNLRWHRADLAEAIDWNRLLDGVSTVYHLAWSSLPQSANADPAGDALENIVGSVRLLAAIRGRSGCRVVFASSGGTVYGAVATGRAREDDPKHPRTAYGVSKLSVESYLAHFRATADLDYAALRLANPYGPDQEAGRNFGVVATFVARALARETCVIFGDGRTERDFIYVDDAIQALLEAGRQSLPHPTYNIGSGLGRSIADVVSAIEQALGYPILLQREPARPFDAPRSVLDPDRARRDFGWLATTSFQVGLRQVIEAHQGRRARP